MKLKVLFFMTIIILFFLIVSHAWGFSVKIVKKLIDDQTMVVFSKTSILLTDQDGTLYDQYRVDPWVIVDGCLIPGEKTIIVILGREGEKRGERLACYSYEKMKIQKQWIDNNRKINPWKILSCDVDGDKRPEVAVGVWKTATFHPVFDNRLFIYAWEKGMVFPKWLGSRLSAPFIDFEFQDFDKDGVQELIALEYQKDGLMRVMGYDWTGFGFIGSAILGKDLHMKNLHEFMICKEGY